MKLRSVFKYILLILLNSVPFFLCCFGYEAGFIICMLILLIQILIVELNYKWTKKMTSYLFLNAIMLVSSISGINITTQLYYHNISSDPGTLAVGNLAEVVAFIFIALMKELKIKPDMIQI